MFLKFNIEICSMTIFAGINRYLLTLSTKVQENIKKDTLKFYLLDEIPYFCTP